MTESQKFWAELRQQMHEARREARYQRQLIRDLNGPNAAARLADLASRGAPNTDRETWLRQAQGDLAIARGEAHDISERLRVHQFTGRDIPGGGMPEVFE